jgi:hypothetical protein
MPEEKQSLTVEERLRAFQVALDALQSEHGCRIVAKQEVEQQGALTLVRLVVRVEVA